MRISNFRKFAAVFLSAALILCIFAGCTAEQVGETLNVMFEELYESGSDISGIGSLMGGENPFVPDSDTEDLPDSGITLEGLMTQLNEQRKNDVRTTISDSSIFLPDYESEEFQAIELSEEELDLLTYDDYSANDPITFEEAENDVDYLFRILKTSYAPYEYFGGDEAFDYAKAAILSELAVMGNSISDYELVDTIVKNLDFVTDSHFTLNNFSGLEFAEEVYYYDSALREFRTDEKGYFTVIDGEKFYVREQDEQYMKLTVGKTGELVYGFITLCEEGKERSLPREAVIGSESGKEYTLELKWKTDRWNYQFDLTWEDTIDGIPLTGIGSMAIDDDASIAEMNDFVNRAKELRNEEVFMLDLRGNMGGLSTISFMWLYNLTNGCEVEGEYAMVYYMSMLNDFVTQGNDEQAIEGLLKFDFFEENPDLKEELLSEEEEDVYGEGYVYDTADTWNEYEGTVFVLCDKAVSSAGEMFILEMMDLENVVVFGTNSNGCLISGGTNYYVPVYLPNSGVSVYYSTILILTDDSERFDARGVQPDVIICGEDEAEAAARCWHYYND